MNFGGRWDITHFLTFGTLLWPQFGFLMNTRYLLGPVGGGERIPLTLRRGFGPLGRIKVIIRWLVQMLMMLNPVFLANLYKADYIFARTGETREMIPSFFHYKTDLLLETAIGPEMIPANTPIRKNEILQIVSVGRLITSKFNLLMFETLVDFKARWKCPFAVTIIGDGPERARLETLCDNLGLSEVTFVGKKPSNVVYDTLCASDIYFSTTMKEAGTWAFFEAIATRLPVVCLKVNGPDMIVGDGCGIKVSPTSHLAAREGLADGLLQLAQNPGTRAELSAKALLYVEQTFSWARVAERIDSTYAALLYKKEGNRK